MKQTNRCRADRVADLARRMERDLDLWTGEPLSSADLEDKRAHAREAAVETTFGQDNTQIVVVSGDASGGPVQTRTFDRSDSVQALSAFLKDRKLSRPRTTVAAHAAAIARANQPQGSVGLTARPAGADYPLPAFGRQGVEKLPTRASGPQSAAEAIPRPATFPPEPVVMSAPTRAGRMIELD
jgi:hypothetical protein